MKKKKISHGEETAEKLQVKGGVLFEFISENYTKSFDYCRKVFDQLYNPIQTKVSCPGKDYKYEHLEKDLHRLREDYLSQAIGPAKWEVFNVKRAEIENQKVLFSKLEGFRIAKFEATQRAELAEANAREFGEKMNKLQKQVKEDALSREKEMQMVREENEEAIKQMKQAAKEELDRELKKQEDLMSSKMAEAAEAAQEKIDRLQRDNSNKLAEMQQAQVKLVEDMTSKQLELADSKNIINSALTMCLHVLSNMKCSPGKIFHQIGSVILLTRFIFTN